MSHERAPNSEAEEGPEHDHSLPDAGEIVTTVHPFDVEHDRIESDLTDEELEAMALDVQSWEYHA